MRRPSPLVVACAAAVAAAAGGVAVAAPGDGATIFACTNNLRESIRFVDAGTTCAAGEQLLSWNQQGPAGPAGERGPQGQAATFERSATVDASLDRAERRFATRPKKPPKKLIAKLIAEDAAPGEARAAYRDGPVTLPSALGALLGIAQDQLPLVVATLALPAGRWVVHAKAQALLDYDPQLAVAAAGDTYDRAACRLRAGLDSDDGQVEGFSGTLALEVVHRYKTPGLVQLECYGAHQPQLTDIKLTAVRVTKLKNQAVGG
jgi:hypothetical protein